MDFTALLLRWFREHRRDLPWKQTTDPYKIWLSEIILQQTRVDQGYSYYLRFVEQYPEVEDLAAAPLDEVLKLWQGLGYYSRARNLHHTAQMIVREFKGKFPRKYEDILKLKGVGAYTAAAIASFAYGEPVAALDGNAYRVLSRVFGVEAPIDGAEGKKAIQHLAEEVLPAAMPGAFNQAMMDFGSLVCTPRNAQCLCCPLNEGCYAHAHSKVYELPVKSKKVTVRTRYLHYFIVSDGKNTLLHQRSDNDIWKGLYEFPLIETTEAVGAEDIIKHPAFKKLFGKRVSADTSSALSIATRQARRYITHYSSLVKHQLTHQTLWARFYAVAPEALSGNLCGDFLRVPLAQFDRYSIPRLIDAFLEKHAEKFLFRKKND